MTGWVDHGLVPATGMSLGLAAAGGPAADVVHHSLAVVGCSGSGSVEHTVLAEA